jgi:aminoglycoside phosphotransferase (APT) family kinase protein
MKIEGSLEKYLKSEILPQLAPPPYGTIKAINLSQKMPVLLFRDQRSNAKVVGKSFQYGSVSIDKAWERAEREYHNLKLLRDTFNMDKDPYRIVTPLGRNRDLSALLVVEYASGNTLDYYIRRAIQDNKKRELPRKLGNLAHFLVKLHSNTESSEVPSPEVPRKYLKKLLHSIRGSFFTDQDAKTIKDSAGDWWKRQEAFDDHTVLAHGDATPTNFVFHHGKVVGIDLEKMKRADRCWDLGFITAELKHNFMLFDRNGWEAEPYIGYLLWEYASAFAGENLFKRVTQKLPLYMALGLLRIARNSWLSEKHRYNLVKEAKQCLKYKP